MSKKKTTKKSQEQITTPTPEEIYAGCEKGCKIIRSLNLPDDVLNDVLDDDDALDAILRERGYV